MRILCFGDSNTYGFDPRDFWGESYDPDNRWVDLLAKHTKCEVINDGSNGRTIPVDPHLLLSRIQYVNADILLIMLGTNDLLQGASAVEAAAKMEGFLMRLLPHFRHILLIAPPPMKRGVWVPTEDLIVESDRLGEECRLLAEKLQIPFADTRSWNVELTFDGVHFSESGTTHLRKILQKN